MVPLLSAYRTWTFTPIIQLLGYASLRAGIDLKDVTRASVEQAAATRSLAIDSKRDGEIMKIITVVTLFYLPAMFVTVRFSSING